MVSVENTYELLSSRPERSGGICFLRKKSPPGYLPDRLFQFSIQCGGQAAFFICLTFAQRALWAAAIFLRAATESVLRRGLV